MQTSLRAIPYLVLLAALLAAGRLPAQAGAWQLVSDRNGIQVYMQPGDRTPLKTFRGVTRLALADEYAMVALLNDYQAYPDWLHFVDNARELGRSNQQVRQLHFTTLLPWPLADREAVLQTRVIQGDGPDGKEVVVDLSNRPDLLPPDPDYVRFPHIDEPGRVHPRLAGQYSAARRPVLHPGAAAPGGAPRRIPGPLLRLAGPARPGPPGAAEKRNKKPLTPVIFGPFRYH